MKRIATIISVVAASMMFSALPVLADEEAVQGNENQVQQQQGGQKDECLVYAINCENNTDTIQQRIDRLNREIQKGTDVYSADELGILNDQLNELIDVLMKDRPSS
jgi:hypothetical protein